MRMTRHELRTRLLVRVRDPQFASDVTAFNDALIGSAQKAVPAESFHEATTVEEFLKRTRDAFGAVGFELEDTIRDGFARGIPRTALLYLAATQARSVTNARAEIAGMWRPRSVAELLAAPEHELAVAIYRTLLWRDPTEREHIGVTTQSRAGADRRDVIASVAALPAARHGPVPVEGIIFVDALLGAHDDGTFLDQLYRTLLQRDPDPEGVHAWRAALRGGVRRDEVVRRFIAQVAAIFPNRVYVGIEQPRGNS